MASAPKRLADVDLRALAPAPAFPSPPAWEDEILYFALVDRFSDGEEKGVVDVTGNPIPGSTPLFAPADRLNAVQTEADAARWREAGRKYVGGNLRGMRDKLGYLKRLGVTAIWISPVFKQVSFDETYHGYGIQDFLQVNPRFGDLQDLQDLVKSAHESGIRVLLDIILNHSGNVFSYDPDRYPRDTPDKDPRWDNFPYKVKGFNDKTGGPTLPFRPTDANNPASFPDADGAVWPVEFQDPAVFTAKGHITNFDFDPEFREGDFFDLKDIRHGSGEVDDYTPAPALNHLAAVYKYWMAVLDHDGYRIDTVKHMDRGATRFFVSNIKEFAQSIGKNNFLLVGEITGGRQFAVETLGITGLDAALGIDDFQERMEFLVKGTLAPNDYFVLFRNSELIGKASHAWFRNKVVTMLNDHDQVVKGANKARFCADPGAERLILAALALNVTTLGIPCLYYGTEQAFDGHGSGDSADRFIREAMFGGEFGAFASRGRHFFDEANPIFQELSKILALRRARPALRRGRQYLRQISGDGIHFGLPAIVGGEIRSVVPWSRILSDDEIVLAINTDPDNAQTAWVTVDASLHRPGETFRCQYSTDAAQIGQAMAVEARNGTAIQVAVPPAGFLLLE